MLISMKKSQGSIKDLQLILPSNNIFKYLLRADRDIITYIDVSQLDYLTALLAFPKKIILVIKEHSIPQIFSRNLHNKFIFAFNSRKYLNAERWYMVYNTKGLFKGNETLFYRTIKLWGFLRNEPMASSLRSRNEGISIEPSWGLGKQERNGNICP